MTGQRQPTYAAALAKDRDLYLRQRNMLAKLLRCLIDCIGDHGQEMAVRDAKEYLWNIGLEDDE